MNRSVNSGRQQIPLSVIELGHRMRINHPINPQQKFEDWFARPLSTLATLKDGDAAFVAFGMSLALYERFIKAKLKKNMQEGTPANFKTAAAEDLGITRDDFSIWWEIFRDGINHQASPKKVKKSGIEYKWAFSASYPAIPKRVVDCFQVNPWGFADLVISKYRSDPIALAASDTYSLGDIGFEIQ